MHIHSTGDSNVAEMQQLLSDPVFCRHAMKVITANLWDIAACIAFADGTFTTEQMYNACTLYHPTAFATGEVPDIYKLPDKTAPIVLSIDSLPKTRFSRRDRRSTQQIEVLAPKRPPPSQPPLHKPRKQLHRTPARAVLSRCNRRTPRLLYR